MEQRITISAAQREFAVGKHTLHTLIARGELSVEKGADRTGRAVKLLAVSELEAHGYRRKEAAQRTEPFIEERIDSLAEHIDGIDAELAAIRETMDAVLTRINEVHATVHELATRVERPAAPARAETTGMLQRLWALHVTPAVRWVLRWLRR